MNGSHVTHPGLAAWAAVRASGASRAALVTLIRADGGASRSLGTHLALGEDGRTFGSVTVGGCGNGRALEAAQRVLTSGAGERLTVPFSEEDALALGLGCAGDVDLLVERVTLDDGDATSRVLDDAVRSAARGERTILLTPIALGGRRLLVHADGSTVGATGDVGLDASGRALAAELHEARELATGIRRVEGDEWFVELLAPVRTVLVVGATEVAAAICAIAAPLGWRAVVIDTRDDALRQSRFAVAAERIASLPAEVVAERLRESPASAVVVVAHDYRVERPVLRAALSSESPYVGMLGSRKRGAGMRAMLVEDGLDADRVARLRSPIGLAIGANGPVEIAVSIVAELIAAWRGVDVRP